MYKPNSVTFLFVGFNEDYKRKADTRSELLASILDAAACTKKREDEFLRILGYYAAWGGLKPSSWTYWPLKMEPKLVPKRRFETTSRRVITQKTEAFSPNAAETLDRANVKINSLGQE